MSEPKHQPARCSVANLSDYQFLWWIHERLTNIYFERRSKDYMVHLRAIIARTPKDQQTPNAQLEGSPQ